MVSSFISRLVRPEQRCGPNWNNLTSYFEVENTCAREEVPERSVLEAVHVAALSWRMGRRDDITICVSLLLPMQEKSCAF